MITKIFNLFKKKSVESVKIDWKMYATMWWDFYPTTTKWDWYVLPRSAEKILRSKYYPTGKVWEFPVDPETWKKLEINPF